MPKRTLSNWANTFYWNCFFKATLKIKNSARLNRRVVLYKGFIYMNIYEGFIYMNIWTESLQKSGLNRGMVSHQGGLSSGVHQRYFPWICSLPDSNMEGIPCIFVDQSWVGSMLQQQWDHRQLALGAGKHQWSPEVTTTSHHKCSNSTLSVHAGLFWCFHNTPSYDSLQKLAFVCDHFVCVRACVCTRAHTHTHTHTGPQFYSLIYSKWLL